MRSPTCAFIGPPVAIATGGFNGGVLGVALALSVPNVFLRPFDFWCLLTPPPVGLRDVFAGSTPQMSAVVLAGVAGLFVTDALNRGDILPSGYATIAGAITILAKFWWCMAAIPKAVMHRQLFEQNAATCIAGIRKKIFA